ncbi:winged helix-turn-helix transcriptional regulator [Chloroflexota bacterium]
MTEVLRNKNLATRFQILVEVADSGPNIQQQDIARKLNVTPQAISEYIRQLVAEGFLVSDGRSKYRLTGEGVNRVIKVLRELREYDTFIERAITNISVCAAVAADDLSKGQKIGLEMKDGLLYATGKFTKGAKGVASNEAKAGEDVGVSKIEGIVEMEIGKVTILKVPGIQRGGSKTVDMEQLKNEVIDRNLVGAIGIEAIITLKKLGIKHVYIYGVTEAAIEAARSGICPVIVCVDDETPNLTRKLGEENIDYKIVDIKKD